MAEQGDVSTEETEVLQFLSLSVLLPSGDRISFQVLFRFSILIKNVFCLFLRCL